MSENKIEVNVNAQTVVISNESVGQSTQDQEDLTAFAASTENVEDAEVVSVAENEGDAGQLERPIRTAPSLTEEGASPNESDAKKAASREVTKDLHKRLLEVAATHAKLVGGLETKDQKGFVQFLNPKTGHKLYVSKGGKSPRIDCSIEANAMGEIAQPFQGENGRIRSSIIADEKSLKEALDTLALFDEKIPAPRRNATK